MNDRGNKNNYEVLLIRPILTAIAEGGKRREEERDKYTNEQRERGRRKEDEIVLDLSGAHRVGPAEVEFVLLSTWRSGFWRWTVDVSLAVVVATFSFSFFLPLILISNIQSDTFLKINKCMSHQVTFNIWRKKVRIVS